MPEICVGGRTHGSAPTIGGYDNLSNSRQILVWENTVTSIGSAVFFKRNVGDWAIQRCVSLSPTLRFPKRNVAFALCRRAGGVGVLVFYVS